VSAGAATELPTLWHFRISHYNEKARWALDWKQLPHRRRALVPGPHVPRMLWESGQRKVPALRIDGETIADSTRIIAALEARHPEPPLYPADPAARARALALEDYFDEELGPHIRRVVFHHLLQDAPAAVATLAVDEPPLTQLVYRVAFPLIRTVMRRDLGIDDAGAAVSAARVADALARLEAEIQPSGYLVGDAFSVADLTAAAMLGPLLRADEFPYRLPPLVRALAAWRASMIDRPGMQWAHTMYRRHRGSSSEVAA
jgi:glutathione S-transferase